MNTKHKTAIRQLLWYAMYGEVGPTDMTATEVVFCRERIEIAHRALRRSSHHGKDPQGTGSGGHDLRDCPHSADKAPAMTTAISIDSMTRRSVKGVHGYMVSAT
jgi:hypothetical protein